MANGADLFQPLFHVDFDVDALASLKDPTKLAEIADLDVNAVAGNTVQRLLEIGAWVGVVAPASDCVTLVLDRFIFIDMECATDDQWGIKAITTKIATL